MATPHIAGLGAYLLGLGKASPKDLCGYISKTAVSDAISNVPSGTANRLANNGISGGNATVASFWSRARLSRVY